MTIARSKVPVKDQWNLNPLYNSFASWKDDLMEVVESKKAPHWPKFAKYKGKLGQSPATLKKALERMTEISRKLSKLYTYAHLKHDEDITENDNKSNLILITQICNAFNEECTWFEPEILELSEAKLKKLITSPGLEGYKFYIEKIVRLKKHTLDAKSEEIIAKSVSSLSATAKAFSAINDADFRFDPVLDSHKKAHELTQSTYGVYLKNQDRVLRKNAFDGLLSKYQRYENTMCELLNGTIQSHHFFARTHHYPSSLDASLFSKNINTDVYYSLIATVNENIDVLHRYMRLRTKVLDMGPLHLYDLHVPLIKELDAKMSYEEAEKVVVESVAPLGEEYQNILRKGLTKEGWVDRFPNLNKRSGAYSSGCYDSSPYILLNFKEQLRDVFTLAHEAGHSMHSYLSHKHQPYQYADYPIFLAEVASTFNEDLLTRYLLSKAKTKKEKIYLINNQLDDIRATLFRQTMFAEFELFLHQSVEKNIPLTPRLLKEEYSRLNAIYHGPIVIDPLIELEWARIPHFYYNFYVYQYATGVSAALALSEKVVNGGRKEREAYLDFLKSGCSKYPVESLKKAGVDMRTKAPVKAAIDKFKQLVIELEQLLGVKDTPQKIKKKK